MCTMYTQLCIYVTNFNDIRGFNAMPFSAFLLGKKKKKPYVRNIKFVLFNIAFLIYVTRVKFRHGYMLMEEFFSLRYLVC